MFEITDTGYQKYKIVPKSNTTCGLAAYGTSNGTGSGITPTSAGNVFIQTYSGVNNQLWYIEEFNGRHEEYYANLTSLMYPFENASVAKTVNSGYGYRLHPIELIDKFHNGIDMSTSEGTELYPMFKVGKVVKCGYDSSMGNYIYIESNYNYAYGTTTKLRSVYMHMREHTSFSVGSNVRFNEVVGYVGTTGSSTGNHLHLAMIIDGGTSLNINSTNNPLMYLKNYSPLIYN